MSTKNPILTGAELALAISGQNAAIRNDGTEVIYVSAKPNITPGADGVVSIPVGQSVVLSDIHGAVYLLGTGGATVIGSDCYENPFKTSAQAGGSGADEVARAAIRTHAGNADIHVTAAEKAAWNGKAELSDIPETLPANGGNSDTVDGLHASDFYQIATGLRNDACYYDIFSTTLSNNHKCWNKWCCVVGNSSDTSTSDYINNAPESGYVALEYEVFTGGYPNRAFQLAIGCFSWQDKTFIRYQQDGNWSGWKNIADGGNAASVGAYTESAIAALEARISALEAK